MILTKSASYYRTLSCDLLFIFSRALPSPYAPFGRSPLYFLCLMIAHELPPVKQISYAWIHIIHLRDDLLITHFYFITLHTDINIHAAHGVTLRDMTLCIEIYVYEFVTNNKI